MSNYRIQTRGPRDHAISGPRGPTKVTPPAYAQAPSMQPLSQSLVALNTCQTNAAQPDNQNQNDTQNLAPGMQNSPTSAISASTTSPTENNVLAAGADE